MDRVMCPYCGAEMELHESEYWYQCQNCGSQSPYAEEGVDTLAAAMTRWVEPNRALTLEEVESWGNKERLPIWLEFRYQGGSKIMVASLYGGMSADGIHLYDQGWRAHPRGGYGKRYRIWLRRPTDEERRVVVWE